MNAPPTSRSAERTGLPRRAWPYLVLAALAVLFCGRAVFTGKALFPFDVLLVMTPWKSHAPQFPGFQHAHAPMLDPVQQYYPWRHFAVEALGRGVIPLWNPYAFAGTPFVANLQSAVFYPPNLLFLAMPLWRAFTWGAVLHVFLAGAFTCGLLRALGLRQLPALIGAAAFMFNGFLVAWLEYPAFGLWVMIWLPLVLLLYEQALRRHSWGWALATGVAIGVQFTGGQLQFSAYLVLFWLGYALLRWIWPPQGEGRSIWPALIVASAALLGLALAGVQLLPTLELAPRSHRPEMPPQAIRGFALPLTHLVQYLVPNFFGNPADYNYWGHVAADRPGEPGMFWETSGYVGASTLVLALVGAGLWRQRLPRIFLVLAVACLLLALGTPLYLALYYLVPGFKQLGGVARTVYPAALALACLAAFGADSLMGEERRDLRWFWRLAPAGCAAAVIAALAWFWPQITTLAGQGTVGVANFSSYLTRQICTAVLLLTVVFALIALRRVRRLPPRVFGGLALLVCVGDLFLFGSGFNPATDPKMAYFETPSIRYLQDHLGVDRMLSVGEGYMDWMPPNTPTVYRLRDIQGSDSLWWGRMLRLLRAAQPEAPRPDWQALDSPILDLLAVRHLITTHEIRSPRWRLAATFAGEPTRIYIYQRVDPLPRARLVHGGIAVVPADQAIELLAQPDVPGRSITLLDRAVPCGPTTRPETVRFSEPSPNRTRAVAKAAAPAALVTADPAYPGWRVTVGGKPAQPVVANGLFRAVALPAGEHVVEWSYEPTSFRLGLFITLAALALAAGAGAGWMVARRR